MSRSIPTVAVLYHYMYPDDVVSARHFDGLCHGLAERCWHVIAYPSNRSCRARARNYPYKESRHGVEYQRVWRPDLPQVAPLGRLLNSLWVSAAWIRRFREDNRNNVDAVIIGTDPVLSVLTAPAIRRRRPGIKIVHWCFDLYPEAAVAGGMFDADSPIVNLLKRRLKTAYASCDLIADIGGDMRTLLAGYGSPARRATLIPWAMLEPSSVSTCRGSVRRLMFGDSRLAILYSGSFGKAHACGRILTLARMLRNDGVSFCFAVRGNCVTELKNMISSYDTNIRITDFASDADLEETLLSADIHVASLRDSWTGAVVPSKFFGSIAAGRPVLFEGSAHSSIAGWIRQHGVGWVLDSDEAVDDVAQTMRTLIHNELALSSLQCRCREIYHTYFRKSLILDSWDRELRGLLDQS